MEVKYLAYNNIDFQQNLSPTNLKIINGIQFTYREIDTIACILGGRASKKIASFLSITSKTVENHIYNIMLKLGCNSRDSIIDFIEKSDKFSLVKKHYSNLLVQTAFKLELQKISTKTHLNNSTCLIAYSKEQKCIESLMHQLEKHLKFSGIKTCVEIQEKYSPYLRRIDQIESQYINIIYCLPGKFLDQLQTKELSLDISNLAKKNNKKISFLLFFFMENETSVISKASPLSLVKHIKLSEQKNYHFLVFEILEILLPADMIRKNISEFKRQYEMLRGLPIQQMEIQKRQLLPKDNLNLTLLSVLKNRQSLVFLGVATFCLASFFLFFLNFNAHERQKMGFQQIKPTLETSKTSKSSALFTAIETGQLATWNLPRQDNLFIGRKKLLDALHIQLQSSEKKETKNINHIPLAIIVCKGLGGTGKTQLALKYAHEYKNNYTLCAWFSAENGEFLQRDYMSFAKALGYSEDKPSVIAAQQYVNNYLKKNSGWLLIFDNASHYDIVKSFLPEQGGSVLITSQYQYWPQTIREISVDVMEEEDAINLVKKIAKKDETETQDIKNLVKTLGALPLALDHASAFICHRNLLISEYLSRYTKNQKMTLIDETSPIGVRRNPVVITLGTAFSAIEAENTSETPSLSSMLLLFCAYLVPERIPTDALVAWVKTTYPMLKEPQLAVDKALMQLQAYSLITIHNDHTLSLHCLVQEVIRSYHQQSIFGNLKIRYPALTPEWYEKVLEALHTEFCRETKILENEARQSRLAPHLQMAVNHYKTLWPTSLSSSRLAQLLYDIGDEYYKKGLYRDAKHYWGKALIIFEKHYGSEHVEVASTLNNLGIAIRYLGDATKAKLYHERALMFFEKRYGLEHIQVARTLNHLGTAIRERGDAETAKKLYERALAIDEKHYGSEHVEVARTLGNVANAIRYLGNTEKAKQYYERTLTIFEKHYGEGHVEVARALNNLGTAVRELGDAATAKKLYERALAIDEKYYGSEHVAVARTLGNIANATRELGDAETAKKLYERALPINEKHYGLGHVEVARTLNNLGTAIRYLGDFKTAKLYHERALPINVKHYGSEHIEVARTLNNLAVVIRELGDFVAAKELHEHALVIQEKHYGKGHVQVTETLRDLANTIKKLDSATQSKEMLKRAIAIRENFYGRNHVEVAKILIDLADVYFSLNNKQEAHDLALRAHTIFKKNFGKSHPYTQRALKYVEGIIKYKLFINS